MSTRCDRANAVFLAVSLATLAPLQAFTIRPPVALPLQAGCGPSEDALNELRANVGMDAGIAKRANDLADAAEAGRPPAPTDIDQLANDSFDSLDDASREVEEVGIRIQQRLQGLNLPRQTRAWSQGMNRLRNSRTRYSTWRPKRNSQRPVEFSRATGGSNPIYSAANDLVESVDNLAQIAQSSGFEAMGPSGTVASAKPDLAPPPNPSADPWQEYMRRLRAQQARAQAANQGLNAARALQEQQVRAAQQATDRMFENIERANQNVEALKQLMASCPQPQNTARPQNPSATPDTAPTPNPPQPAAKKGGGFGTGMAVLLGLGVAGGAAYYAYQQYYACPAYTNTANYNACVSGSGSCSTCTTALNEMQPYCQCYESKGLATPGICAQVQDAVDYAYATGVCRAPDPKPAVR